MQGYFFKRSTSALSLILLTAVLAFTLSGCGKGGSGGGGSSTAPAGNTLRYALTASPTTFDPAMVQDGVTIDLLLHVYEGLVQWNEKGEIVPNLAERWEISKDSLTYTFFLKKGVKFHNGREMTAEDVKYSLERALDPKLASPVSATYLRGVKGAVERFSGPKESPLPLAGVTIIDPSTIQIQLTGPRPYFLGELTYPTSCVVAKEIADTTGGKPLTDKTDAGTGAFKLDSYQTDFKVVLSAFDGYHGGKPKIARIERPVQKDAQQRINMYKQGLLDIADVQSSLYESVKADPALSAEVKLIDRAATHYIAMSQVPTSGTDVFKNPKVRQAIALAVSKDDLIKLALNGIYERADGIVPPGVFGHNANRKPQEYNVEKARTLLAQAGYPGGKGFPEIQLYFREQQPERTDLAQVLQKMLKDNLNIVVKPLPMEWGTFLTKQDNSELPFYINRWAADYLDAQNYLTVMLHTNAPQHPNQNFLGYSNPQYDALCDQADVALDPKERLRLYAQAEEIAMSEVAWLPVYYQRDIDLIKPYVKGVRESPLARLPNVATELAGQ